MASSKNRERGCREAKASPGGAWSQSVGWVSPRDPAGVAVQAAFASAALGLLANEPAARGGDAEGVHHMRTTTRRLRGELRIFGPFVDADWKDSVESELKWLADVLGQVRDLDVLGERLRNTGADLLDPLAPLFADVRERHCGARRALDEALQGDRYHFLLGSLGDAASHPKLMKRASKTCRRAIPPRVEKLWDKLKRAGRALRPEDPDDQYHDARKRAKRVRYAAEFAASVLGHRATRAAEALANRAHDLQDVLGQLQDAAVARQTVERVARAHPDDGPFQLAAGRVIERQLRIAREAREQFPEAWQALDRKSLRSWLKD